MFVICLSICGVCAAFCVLCWLPVYFSVIMGQTTSTPLSLMINHFSDFKSRAQNLSLLVKKSKLVTFCSTEWPTFDVGWPQEGTFNPQIIQAVKERVLTPSPAGHPDQTPYILVWQDLVRNPPEWLKPFVLAPPKPPRPSSLTPTSPSPQVLVMKASKEKEGKKDKNRPKPVFQESSLYPNLIDLETELFPST